MLIGNPGPVRPQPPTAAGVSTPGVRHGRLPRTVLAFGFITSTIIGADLRQGRQVCVRVHVRARVCVCEGRTCAGARVFTRWFC